MRVLAGIVTYHPEKERLKQNIESIITQVDKVIIIDNGSENLDFLDEFVYQNVTVIKNHANLGMAKALNILVEYADKYHYDWVITLDQDSVIVNGIVNEYLKYVHLKDVGAMTCLIRDRNRGVVYEDTEQNVRYVNECITSGCFCNVEILKNIGGFDNALFIDLVDTEYCYNLKKHDYKIMQILKVGLLHEMGHATVTKLGPFGVTVFNEVPLRHYYISRNWVYVYKRYKEKKYLFRLLYSSIKTIFFEKQKIKKMKAISWGIYDGITNKMYDCKRRI